MEKICVIGLGYIGLPTASILANKEFPVLGVDIRGEVVDRINGGGVHFHEPDLDVLVRSAVNSGFLKASQTISPADIYILAVPTPLLPDGSPDISHLETAASSIAPFLEPGNLIIIESTIPVGTSEKIGGILAKLRPELSLPQPGGNGHYENDEQIYLAHCPERVLPGRVLVELVENDRIVGGLDVPSGKKAQAFYRYFSHGEVIVTDARTAEMIKLTENAFRDVNIAFANELSIICDELGLNVWELIALANHHPRVNILKPGPGVGGHCIAIDPWFIVSTSPQGARLIRQAREVNDSKPLHVVKWVEQVASRYQNPTIACLGLTYKADIGDLRESPALSIVRTLASKTDYRLLAVDPHIEKLPEPLAATGRIELVTLDKALDTAEVVLLLVDHREFLELDPARLQSKSLIDTRGVWPRQE